MNNELANGYCTRIHLTWQCNQLSLPLTFCVLESFFFRPVCARTGFTGKLLETPKKIVVLMPFGFEVEINVEKCRFIFVLCFWANVIQYNSITGGHFRNCTERAVGPGWAKNGIFELLLSLLISILDFSLFGFRLTTNPCLQAWTISMCMQYRMYLVMLLKVTAIFIAESVVTHKGVSRMFPQQLNGRFVQWCSPKWP